MIVTVFENQREREMNMKLLMESDLALVKTDERSWDDEAIYRVSKTRFADQGTLIKAGELHTFVQQQEEKTLNVKRDESTVIDTTV